MPCCCQVLEASRAVASGDGECCGGVGRPTADEASRGEGARAVAEDRVIGEEDRARKVEAPPQPSTPALRGARLRGAVPEGG
eukprot:4636568-Alexandrium_andersonii.AAC.1